MKEAFEQISIPEVIYHDNEGSWSSTEFIRLINPHKINQIITSTPPPFAESMVKTIKHMIHTRLEGLEMDKEKRIDMLGSVLKNTIVQNIQQLVSVLMKQLSPVIILQYG